MELHGARGQPRLALGAVDEVFAEAKERLQVPGIAYGVVARGALVHARGIGVRECAGGAPVDSRTVFRIASMTKSVTAACVLLLRDEGRLHLDDPVSAHLPQLARLPLPSRDSLPPTLRQLLSMSAGLVEDDPWADRQLALAQGDFGAMLAQPIPFDHSPGVAFEYSNYGYALLGEVAEAVSGVPLTQLATERLLLPLGMRDTVWSVQAVPPARAARGYRREGEGWVEEPALEDGAFAPMGGLWTTVEDFARYVLLQLDAWPPRDDPELGPLRRSSRREMQQPARLRPAAAGNAWLPASGYGFGLIAGESPRYGRVVGHGGGLPGFGSYVAWLPDLGIGVFAFANLTYARMSAAVEAAIDALAEGAGLTRPTEPPSPALEAAWSSVQALYEAWDDGRARQLAADNLFLDAPLATRRQLFWELRQELGAARAAEHLPPGGALRGRWRLRCERGDLEVSIWLSPTNPPLVQMLRLSRMAMEPPAPPPEPQP